MSLLSITGRLGRLMTVLRGQQREDNHFCCDSPHLRQQLPACLPPSEASAIPPDCQCKRSSTCLVPTELQSDSSEHKTYLCEYIYGSKKWVIEINGTSQSDAAARLKAISEGRILGPIHAVIPVELGWVAKLLIFLRNRFV